jgi:hypothetical protein
VTIADALENLRVCSEEFEAADHACQLWSELCGPGIWREGHPLDRMKLCRRRRAKLDLKRARWYVDHALADASAAGCG